jgi:hypothetical protein
MPAGAVAAAGGAQLTSRGGKLSSFSGFMPMRKRNRKSEVCEGSH